jgi:hypothetical protein
MNTPYIPTPAIRSRGTPASPSLNRLAELTAVFDPILTFFGTLIGLLAIVVSKCKGFPLTILGLVRTIGVPQVLAVVTLGLLVYPWVIKLYRLYQRYVNLVNEASGEPISPDPMALGRENVVLSAVPAIAVVGTSPETCAAASTAAVPPPIYYPTSGGQLQPALVQGSGTNGVVSIPPVPTTPAPPPPHRLSIVRPVPSQTGTTSSASTDIATAGAAISVKPNVAQPTSADKSGEAGVPGPCLLTDQQQCTFVETVGVMVRIEMGFPESPTLANIRVALDKLMSRCEKAGVPEWVAYRFTHRYLPVVFTPSSRELDTRKAVYAPKANELRRAIAAPVYQRFRQPGLLGFVRWLIWGGSLVRVDLHPNQ